MGRKEGCSRQRKQQVQKLGGAKGPLFTPSPASPSFPSWTQYIPLRAWLYRDGFARFSNTRFTLSSIDDQCILGSLPTHPPCTLPLPSPSWSGRTYSFHRGCGLGTETQQQTRWTWSLPPGPDSLVGVGEPPGIPGELPTQLRAAHPKLLCLTIILEVCLPSALGQSHWMGEFEPLWRTFASSHVLWSLAHVFTHMQCPFRPARWQRPETR